MEFLRSFLRRHLAEKPVIASPNVGCFLRLYPAIQMLVPLHLPLLGFLLLLFLCVSVCVLYYKFILYITRGAPNKAVKKITITPGKCQLYI